MSTTGDGISRASLVFNTEIIIDKRKRNEGQLSETLTSFGRINDDIMLYASVKSQNFFLKPVRNPRRQPKTNIFYEDPSDCTNPDYLPIQGDKCDHQW